MEKKVRVGILGGTFNPIHLGHLLTGECAYEQFELDEVVFMPSKTPPHKSIEENVSAKNRADMVKLAIEDNPHFTFSGMELERSGVTYTVDTLRLLNEMHPDREYYFIIGGDSLFSFHKWRETGEILKRVTVLAASRYGVPEENVQSQIDFLKKEFGGRIEKIAMPTIDISSSGIRQKIKEGGDIRYYVPEDVRLYIQKNGLYK